MDVFFTVLNLVMVVIAVIALRKPVSILYRYLRYGERHDANPKDSTKNDAEEIQQAIDILKRLQAKVASEKNGLSK